MKRLLMVALLVYAPLTGAQDPEPDWYTESFHRQSEIFTRFRTSPSTWQTDGGFGLQWGMGPGDVRKVYPKLEHVFSSFYFGFIAYQEGSFKDIVEDVPVKVHVTFHRGRLIAVSVQPENPSLLNSEDFGSDLKDFRKKLYGWCLRLKHILDEKYGTPTEEASLAALQSVGPSSRWIGGAAKDEPHNFVWKKGSTIIDLDIYGGLLTYSIEGALNAYENALKEARLRQEIERRREKKIERERL